MKFCRGCGHEKQRSEFPENQSSPDGKHSRCRECRAVTAKARRTRPEVKVADVSRSREQYQANRSSLLAKRKERYAAQRDIELRRNRAWSDAHREQHRNLCRQWAKDNPEAARALVSKRRARIAGASGNYNKDDIAALMAEQGGLCAACKCDLEQYGYHIDHVMPISKGGANGKENLQLLCPTCNRRKGAKLPEEWSHGFHR